MDECTDADTLSPVTQPLFTLQELYEWTSDKSDLCQSRIPFPGRNGGQSRPKMLVCHDMRGGYLEDRFVQGVSEVDCFRFHHWWKIDTFIYFSHHLVTLPPTCWIDAGHRHGVKVLGTLITEWEAGRKVCEEFLKDETTFKMTADQLVLLAQYYHFDGWLINIENELQAEQASVLQEFLRYLTREMHEHIEHSEVIWYDSVTNEGKLDWQNELNEKNCCFFEACDGIFLNYTWKDGNLQASADVAGNLNRLHDVFVGIDVYGRGCFGGGGYDTNMAMQVAKTHDLSVAVFGIGWTLEKCETGENFVDRDERYWKLLKNFCPKRKLLHLPVVTSFCQGWGQKYYCHGQVLSNTSWTALSLQQVQPTEDGDSDGMKYITTDGYLGGGCLEFTQSDHASQIRIFSMETVITDELLVSYTYKAVTEGQFALQLTLVSSDDTKTIRFHLANNDGMLDHSSVTEKTQTTDDSVHFVEDIHLRASGADSNSYNWVTRMFLLPDVKAKRLTDISIVFPCNNKTCTFRLGGLRVVPEQVKASSKSAFDRLTESDDCRKVFARLDVKENFQKKLIITDDGNLRSDEQHLMKGHLLTEVENTNEGPVCTLEQSVNPHQPIQPENENATVDEPMEKALLVKQSILSMPHMKLTWDVPSDVLAYISRFHVYMWSETKQAWHFMGHTPVCSYVFSLGTQANDFELAKFKLEAVLVTGDLVPGVNMNIADS